MRLVAACAAVVLAAVVVTVVALTASGGGHRSRLTTTDSDSDHATYSATSPVIGTPAPTHDPPAADERVIRRWADSLRRGDVARAARLFALPSVTVIAPGGSIVELRTRAQAHAFNAALPCGARLLRTEHERGQGAPGLTVGVFRLTERAGATCDGPGVTARVGFSVNQDHITRWIRLADRPRRTGPAEA